LKITIIATHSFPIPYKTHTGDTVILDLAKSLQEAGHEVNLIAPEKTEFNNLFVMPASYGKFPPSSEECEEKAFQTHKDMLMDQDIVHDFSNSKIITANLNNIGHVNTLCTLLGGPWKHNYYPRNLCVWSKAHRSRVLRGATDYEGTPTPNLAGHPGRPIQECHVVYGGIDTDFYCPTDYSKNDYYLWMNRWHPVKGFTQAIEIAKKTGIKLVLAGEHPDNELFDYQRNQALLAIEQAKGHSNITFQWLPKDPDHHTAKRELYRQAKALLYTVQFHEPFGLSQIESLACGTPVIGTNYGSVPELINRSVGAICDNSIDDFVEGIKNLKVSFGQCRQYAVQKFDKHQMAKSYLNEYRLLNNGKSW